MAFGRDVRPAKLQSASARSLCDLIARTPLSPDFGRIPVRSLSVYRAASTASFWGDGKGLPQPSGVSDIARDRPSVRRPRVDDRVRPSSYPPDTAQPADNHFIPEEPDS